MAVTCASPIVSQLWPASGAVEYSWYLDSSPGSFRSWLRQDVVCRQPLVIAYSHSESESEAACRAVLPTGCTQAQSLDQAQNLCVHQKTRQPKFAP